MTAARGPRHASRFGARVQELAGSSSSRFGSPRPFFSTGNMWLKGGWGWGNHAEITDEDWTAWKGHFMAMFRSPGERAWSTYNYLHADSFVE